LHLFQGFLKVGIGQSTRAAQEQSGGTTHRPNGSGIIAAYHAIVKRNRVATLICAVAWLFIAFSLVLDALSQFGWGFLGPGIFDLFLAIPFGFLTQSHFRWWLMLKNESLVTTGSHTRETREAL
jgi:hypothetical protein